MIRIDQDLVLLIIKEKIFRLKWVITTSLLLVSIGILYSLGVI